MRFLTWTIIGAVLAGAFLPVNSMAAENSRQLLDFSDAAETSNYASGMGVSFKVMTNADAPYIEITVDPYEKHGNKWPTFTMAVNAFRTPLDLTNYSHIEVDYEKMTEGLVTFSTTMCTLPYNDRGTNMEYFAITIPGGTAMTQSIDLLEIRKPFNDPSNLQCIQLLLPVTPKVERYRVYALRAVKRPGAETIGDVIRSKADDLRKDIAVLQQSGTADLGRLESMLADVQRKIDARVRTGFAGTYRNLSSNIDDLAAKVNQKFLAELPDDLYIWHYPSSKVLAAGVSPRPISEKVESLSVSLARGTYQSATFMVSSVRDPVEFRVELELPAELIGRSELFYTDYYRIFSQNYDVGDFVTPIEDQPLKLEAGESRELWFRVNSYGLPAGTYAFAVRLIDAAGNVVTTLPGQVTVWPFDLVNYDQMDNYSYAIFPAGTPAEVERHRPALTLMKQYGLNVVELPPHLFDQVTLDGQGNIIAIDPVTMRHSVKGVADLWDELPGDQKIKFQLFVHHNRQVPEDHPNRQEAYLQWIGKVIDELRSYGLSDDQYCFAISDEASLARLQDVDIPLALAMKERWPNVLTFSNSSQVFDNAAQTQQYLDAFDILAPEGNSLRNNRFLREFLLGSGKIKSVYKCDFMGGPNADHYRYYRVFAWESFQMGIYSLGLWTFNAHETPATFYTPEQTITNVGYSLANRNKDGIVVGTRRYQVYHEGLNDLRYLLTLQALDGSVEADSFIADSVADVLAHQGDASRAEMQRQRIAQRIITLQSAE